MHRTSPGFPAELQNDSEGLLTEREGGVNFVLSFSAGVGSSDIDDGGVRCAQRSAEKGNYPSAVLSVVQWFSNP